MFTSSNLKCKLSGVALIASLLLQVQAASAYQQQDEANTGKAPAPEPYSFSYSSQSIGGFSSHQESGDGSGRVSGFYTIQGDDGRERRVDYVADENGYRASVQTNEVGTRSGKSADADFQVQLPSAGQLEAAKLGFEQYQQLEEAHATEQARIQSRQSLARRTNQQQQQQSSAQLREKQQDSLSQRPSGSSSFVSSNSSLAPPSSSSSSSSANQPNSRQSRQPDARDLSLIDGNQLDSQQFQRQRQPQQQQQQQRASWQTDARQVASVAGQQGRARSSAIRMDFPKQQLELQFLQQANQLNNQDYYRQPASPSNFAFENTSQFLIDEPQPQAPLAPASPLPPPPQPRPRQQQPQQQSNAEQNRPVAGQQLPGFRTVNQANVHQEGSILQGGHSGSGEYLQQQQDNIINEPVVELVESVEQPEIPRQPEPVIANQEVRLEQQQPPQPQRQATIYTENYGSQQGNNFSRPTAPSGFLSINLNDNQSDKQAGGGGDDTVLTSGGDRDQEQQVGVVVENTNDARRPVQLAGVVDTNTYGKNVYGSAGVSLVGPDQREVQIGRDYGQQLNYGTAVGSGDKQVSTQMEQQQQTQQEINQPNSVNQIIENFSRQPVMNNREEQQPQQVAVPVVTSRPVATQPIAPTINKFSAKGQQQDFSQEQQPQRQPSRFSNNVVRTSTSAPTFAQSPATTSFSSGININIIGNRQTTTVAPITTTSELSTNYAEEQQQAATTPAPAAVQTAFTTSRSVYQPITTTTTSRPTILLPSTTTTTTLRPVQSTTTTASLARRPQPQVQQQQQKSTGVKGGGNLTGGQQSPLAAILRNKGQNRTQIAAVNQQQQSGFLAAQPQPLIGGRPVAAQVSRPVPAEEVALIATTRAPQIRVPVFSPSLAPQPAAPFSNQFQGDQQQQQLIANNQQQFRQSAQNEQQQQQLLQQNQQSKFNSEAPYSIVYTTEQPQISSVSYVASRQNKTSSSSLANQRFNQQQQQQQPQQVSNDNSIRFTSNQTSVEVARQDPRPAVQPQPIELQQTGNSQKADGQMSYQPSRQTGPGSPIGQQQWRGIKGARSAASNRAGGRQFWQANASSSYNYQSREPTSSTAAAEDYATSLGYGSRVTAPAINLTG